MMLPDTDSPFTPGVPVPGDLFVGRMHEREMLRERLRRASRGIVQDQLSERHLPAVRAEAARRIGLRNFDPDFLAAIESERNREIVRAISEEVHYVIRRSDVLARTGDQQSSALDAFLRRLVELGIVERDETERGAYRFRYLLHPIYLRLRYASERMAGDHAERR